ncbi:MAG: MFS transporter [Pseudomonadota bacterium]
MRINFHNNNHHWWVLGTVSIGIFMATLDASIVNISLPAIMADFKASLAVSEWIVLSYLLVITGLLLPFGRLADMTGRKKIYRLGFVLFSLGSGLCALSQNPAQLIFFRALQAVGAAMLMSNSFAIITAVFPPEKRGRALGIVGTVVATGFTVGPSLGGFLVTAFGWRSIFYINLPVGLVGLIMTTTILNERLVSPTLGQKKSFDFLGAALIIIGLSALLLGLTTGQAGRWGTPLVVFELALAAVTLALVPIWEAKTAQPLIDLTLFNNRIFSFGNLAGFLSFLAISTNAFLMPFFLQLALGYSPLEAGLLMTPTALTIAIVAPISGWLSERTDPRILSTLGLAINSSALFWLSLLKVQSGYHDVLIRLVLLGIGQGLFQSPNNSSVMGSVSRHNLGIAGGFLSLMRSVGQVVGIALAGSILAGTMVNVTGHASFQALHAGDSAAQRAPVLAAFMQGMYHAYLVAALICFLGMWTSLVRGKRDTAIAESPSRGSSSG